MTLKSKAFFLDVENAEFKMVLEGAYWFQNSASSPRAMEKGGIIQVRNYGSFEARYFLPKDKLWRTLDYENLEVIGEVNEKTYLNEELKLAGFGKTNGYWVEYLIWRGEFEICFEE